MRLYKNGIFINEKDKSQKFPSLLTCDMIKPEARIIINNDLTTW